MNRYTSSTLRRLWVAIVVFGGTCAATTVYAAANQLQSVDVQTLPGAGVQVTMTLSGPASEPLDFTIDNPARISFDLADTSLALDQRRIDVRSGGLDSIVAAEAGGRSRVVLNLDRMTAYQKRVEGNRVIVMLGAGAGVAAAAGPVAAQAVAASAAPAQGLPAGGRSIRSIDFRRGNDGAGRVVVQLSDPRTPVNVRQQGNQILVDFAGTVLPSQLQRRFDVTDFATPVSSFDAVGDTAGTRLVVSAVGDFQQLAYQADDQYVIELQPQRQAQATDRDVRPVYTGERMSANFQDIEARTLLQLIADTGGRNIVVNDSVSGSVTLRLQNVPWDQVLDIVLRTKGLDKRVQDNVIIVGLAEELAQQEKDALAAQKDIRELAPLRTEYLQVNYAKVEDIQALIDPRRSLTGAGGAGVGLGGIYNNRLLSDRGSVTIDPRTNTLLIKDTAEVIENIRQLVATLDVPVRQVQIEARIVVVNEDFSRDLGVRAGLTATRSNGNAGLFATSGTAASTDTILGSAIDNLQTSSAAGGPVSPYPVAVPGGAAAPNRYNVNLPVSNPAGSLAFMVLG
ncbi:MAG: AMIN domain-containing protein, partial [Nevskiaceae bacterium]|nr:AMIN domain-containing protein [Nevskiaceae bacterium]